MGRLRPEDLTLSALPRTPLGHLKTDSVGELLQHAAWDYREALAESQRLTKSVEDLGRRVEELMAQVASLEEAAARRKSPDELARSLLASAQRAAREQRESARREGELILKKATERAERVEEDAARRGADRLAEIARLEGFRDELLGRFRGMLETLATRYGADPEDGPVEVEPDQAVAAGSER